MTARWRLLYTEPLDGIDNMALDHALLARAARTGECVLRVYSWASPTVSFGRHQRTAGIYDHLHLPAVRRPTGGRAVLHAREATYSVTAPVTRPLRTAYHRINYLLLDALRHLGVAATLAPPTPAPPPDGAPCFDTATEGEIVVAGRKLAGSAQWRDRGALLQHGSILIDDDQALLGAPPTPPATLRAALGRAPSVPEIADALFDAARATLDPHATPLVDDDLQAEMAALRTHYADDSWTWRA
ncbi:MAG TPA: biotin/lipoate A/B protein ligase family protein [Gemmatimonadaceae bacterium]|nr:biotin/lipoate A/B protein ligase family protein [Gemmatimonadaceae bacterium]